MNVTPSSLNTRAPPLTTNSEVEGLGLKGYNGNHFTKSNNNVAGPNAKSLPTNKRSKTETVGSLLCREHSRLTQDCV